MSATPCFSEPTNAPLKPTFTNFSTPTALRPRFETKKTGPRRPLQRPFPVPPTGRITCSLLSIITENHGTNDVKYQFTMRRFRASPHQGPQHTKQRWANTSQNSQKCYWTYWSQDSSIGEKTCTMDCNSRNSIINRKITPDTPASSSVFSPHQEERFNPIPLKSGILWNITILFGSFLLIIWFGSRGI